MDYETLRHLAGSWGLIYLVITFVGLVLFTCLRPGARAAAEKAARIPFREDRDDE